MKWFKFNDMHTGGFTKTDYDVIYIQANTETDAINVFKSKFQIEPYDIACDCCGYDFAISEENSLQQMTAYERGCEYSKDLSEYIEIQGSQYRDYIPLDDYVKRNDVLVLYKVEGVA